jgi:hypothetical protein
MSAPDNLPAQHAIRDGYRWELDRSVRANGYLRVFFSALVLLYACFGPALLLRFTLSSTELRPETVVRFYAFRPVLFALLFSALVCVLGALAQRAHVLFEAALAEDTGSDAARRQQYIKHLAPSPNPFVLSGNLSVDFLILLVALGAYSLWVVLLVETIPRALSVYQNVGIVLGSYGLFTSVIVIGFVWAGLARRGRRLRSETEQPQPAG